MDTVILKRVGRDDTIVADFVNGTLESVRIGNRLVTETDFDTELQFCSIDTPQGTEWPLSYDELVEISKFGGRVRLHAGDVYRIAVSPMLLDTETISEINEAMVAPWPKSENVTEENPITLGEHMMLALLDALERGEILDDDA